MAILAWDHQDSSQALCKPQALSWSDSLSACQLANSCFDLIVRWRIRKMPCITRSCERPIAMRKAMTFRLTTLNASLIDPFASWFHFPSLSSATRFFSNPIFTAGITEVLVFVFFRHFLSPNQKPSILPLLFNSVRACINTKS